MLTTSCSGFPFPGASARHGFTRHSAMILVMERYSITTAINRHRPCGMRSLMQMVPSRALWWYLTQSIGKMTNMARVTSA